MVPSLNYFSACPSKNFIFLSFGLIPCSLLQCPHTSTLEPRYYRPPRNITHTLELSPVITVYHIASKNREPRPRHYYHVIEGHPCPDRSPRQQPNFSARVRSKQTISASLWSIKTIRLCLAQRTTTHVQHLELFCSDRKKRKLLFIEITRRKEQT